MSIKGSILNTVHETAKGLHSAGVIDDKEMGDLNDLCSKDAGSYGDVAKNLDELKELLYTIDESREMTQEGVMTFIKEHVEVMEKSGAFNDERCRLNAHFKEAYFNACVSFGVDAGSRQFWLHGYIAGKKEPKYSMRITELTSRANGYGFARLKCNTCGMERGQTIYVRAAKGRNIDSICWHCRDKEAE